jgi:hypothetical protein
LEILFRGVHAGHPAMAAARAGRAVPGDMNGFANAGATCVLLFAAQGEAFLGAAIVEAVAPG